MTEAERLAAIADRLDQLADTAELMGDDAGAARWREHSNRLRSQAMDALGRLPGSNSNETNQMTLRASE